MKVGERPVFRILINIVVDSSKLKPLVPYPAVGIEIYEK